MSNPIGYATLQDPPQGLGYHGLVSSMSEHQSGNSGVYWYLAPLGVAGGLVGDPPRCSHTPMTAIGALTGETYDYAPQNQSGPVTPTYTSGLASAAAADSPYELVMVTMALNLAMHGGFPYCGDAIVPDDAILNSFTVTAGGAPLDVMSVSVAGARLPRPHATYTPAAITSYAPGGSKIEGVLMRPTPLSWAFQDPDNHWNRALWQRSEVGSIAWALDAYAFDWKVDGGYSVWGYERQAHFPTPCAIKPPPPPPPPPPSQVLTIGGAGARNGGSVRGKRRLGASVQGQFRSKGRYGVGDLVRLAIASGLAGEAAATAGAVAMAESGGNPLAVNNNPGPPPSIDRGLWQINDYYHPEVSDACAFDPVCAAGAAVTISHGGTDWTPWATFNAGLHEPFMAAARAAAG